MPGGGESLEDVWRRVQPALAELRAHVAASLPAFCAPKVVHVVTQLPRTALGKVQKHLLPAPPA